MYIDAFCMYAYRVQTAIFTCNIYTYVIHVKFYF